MAMPCTMYRWATRNMTASGRMVTSAPAKMPGRLTVCAVRNVDSAICAVHEDGSWPMTSGQRKAFQPVDEGGRAEGGEHGGGVGHRDAAIQTEPARPAGRPPPDPPAAAGRSCGTAVRRGR